MGWYRDGSLRDDSVDLYRSIITGTAGFSGSESPFVDPNNTTVPGGGGGGLGSALLDLVMMNTLGMRNPFRIPSWSEPAAGSLGAYAYSRFSHNAQRMGNAAAAQRAQSRRAFGRIVAYNPITASFYGGNEADMAALQESVAAGDPSGFTDAFAGMFQQVFGLEDYGVAGIRAAQRAEGMVLGRMGGGDARRVLGRNYNTVSDAWKSRSAGVVGEYAREANRAMYEDGTYIRNEDFMRGFSETDVSSVLERVAASARGSEDLGARFATVGKEAIKTLEAFRDLFGSADAAKRMLNQVTGGGWQNMKAEDLTRITNQVRGLQSIGGAAGLNSEQVGNLLATGMVAVQHAMGYTASDVAGGYVNQPFVSNMAEALLANEMANMDPSQLDPTMIQRLRARSTWAAGQFAGSSAARAMTAFEFAIQQGNIEEGSAEYDRIKKLFESGDTKNMGKASEMVAKSLNISMEEMYSDTNYKLFADSVGSDSARMGELMDIGVKAMTDEKRIKMEKQMADTGVDMAVRYAKENGLSRDDALKIAREKKIRYVIDTLEENSDMKGASGLASMIKAEYNKNGAAAAYELFEQYSSDLENTEFAATIKTNAQATAANAIIKAADERGKNNKITGVKASDSVKDILQSKGIDIDKEGISRASAEKILSAYAERSVDPKIKDYLDSVVANGSDSDVKKALNRVFGGGDQDILENSVRNTVFNVKPAEVALSAKITSKQLAKELGTPGDGTSLSVERLYTNGAGGVIRGEEGVKAGLSSVVSVITSNDFMDKVKKEDRAGLQTALAKIQKQIAEGDITGEKGAAAELNKIRQDSRYADAFADSGIKSKMDAVPELSGSSVDSFVGALSADTGAYADIVKINGREFRRDELDSIVNDAAKGVDGLSGLSGDKLYSEIARLQQAAGMGGQEGTAAAGTLNQLYENIANSGKMVTGTSEAEIGGVLGKVATGELIDNGFGGELVAAEEFNKSLKDLSSTTQITTKALEDLGKAVEAIVDKNATSAYNTTQQALVKGLSKNEWGPFVDMFMRPGQTPEQREKVINDISKLFSESGIIEFKKKKDAEGNVVKDENGNDVYEHDSKGNLVIEATHFDKAGDVVAEAISTANPSVDKEKAKQVASEIAAEGNTGSSGGSSDGGDAATETTLKSVVTEIQGLRADMKGDSAGKPGEGAQDGQPTADGDPPG